MSLRDVLNLRPWIEAVPLEAAQSHAREVRIADEANAREWRAAQSDEVRSKMDFIRSMLPNSREQQDSERDNPKMCPVVSPLTLSYVEQYRLQKKFSERDWPTKPVDVIVWALGEAPQRWFTKVGGLPYRPATSPWPTIPPDEGPYPVNEGAPMTFLAQLNFAGSRDLFPQLPGDVLLIFAEDETFSRPGGVYCEWQPLGIPDEELVAAATVPVPAWEFVTCHGFRHRTQDYMFEGDDDRRGPMAATTILDATKIGGYPTLSQSTNEECESSLNNAGVAFLGQLRSIFPHSDEYYPWMNRQEPMESQSENEYLSLVDDGTLYFKLSPSGEVTWEFECG